MLESYKIKTNFLLLKFQGSKEAFKLETDMAYQIGEIIQFYIEINQRKSYLLEKEIEY